MQQRGRKKGRPKKLIGISVDLETYDKIKKNLVEDQTPSGICSRIVMKHFKNIEKAKGL